MIPPTVMTIEDWDRDIRPDQVRYSAMLAWVVRCGMEPADTLAIELTEGAVAFTVLNLGPLRLSRHRHSEAIAYELLEIEVVVPSAPLPPFRHGRRHSLVDEARTA